MAEIDVIQDIANLRSRAAAVAANPGSIAIENVAGTLKQVDDQGTATNLGGAGGVTSVAGLTGAVTGAGLNAVQPVATDSLNGLESAADKTKIDALNGYSILNEVITVGGSAVQDLVLAPTGWALNGDTDGEYEIVGQINLPASSSGFTYSFQPSALATNQNGRVAIFNASNAFQGSPLTVLYLGGGTANAGRMTFRIQFSGKSGRIREYYCVSRSIDLTTGGQVVDVTEGEWTATATVMDATSRLHCDNAAGIGAASFAKIIRTMMAA